MAVTASVAVGLSLRDCKSKTIAAAMRKGHLADFSLRMMDIQRFQKATEIYAHPV